MKKTMKEFIKRAWLWLVAGSMFSVALGFTELNVTWWPVWLAKPEVCFIWLGIIPMTVDKVKSLSGVEAIDGKLYRNCGDEVMMIETDISTELDDVLDNVKTESHYYWAKAES